MNHFARKFLCIAASLCLLLSLAACGGGTGSSAAAPDPADPAASQDTAADDTAAPAVSADSISLWLFAETHSNYFNWVTEEYKKDHPEVDFTIEVMDNEALQNRLAVIITAGGEGSPDLVDIEQGMFSRYMNADKMHFEPLTHYLERDGLMDKLVETRLSLYAFNGTYYGLEHALCPVTMAYRADLFEEYGIAIPTTWDEYKAAAAQFKEHGIYMASFSDMRSGKTLDEISLLLRPAGADYVDDSGNMVITPEWKQVVADIAQMQDDGMLFGHETDEDKWTQYRENRVATDFQADWAAGWLRDNVPEQSGMWEMTYLPKLTASSARTSCRGGTGFAMMEYTKKDKEALWDFMKFALVDTENQVEKYKIINLYPPVYEAMPLCNSPVEYYNNQNLGELYEELAPEMPVQNQAWWRTLFNESYTANIYDYCEGNLSIDELAEKILADTQDKIDTAPQ